MIINHTILSNNKKTILIGNQNIGPSYWIGLSKNGIDYFAGQTFSTPISGIIKTVKLHCSGILGFPTLNISMYSLEKNNHIWKTKLTDSEKELNIIEQNHWIDFDLPNIEMVEEENFGFILKCIKGGMIAISECPWDKPNPYVYGEQWLGNSTDEIGKFQKDFAFAFAVEIDILPKSKFI